MYCTTEDLLAQVPERTLIELTSEEMDFDSPATVNTRVVDSCIRYADELIDAHLRGRYILPLAEIPTVLRDIAITLVRYRLYARRPEGDLPDTVKDDHKEALRQLRSYVITGSRWGCRPLRKMCLSLASFVYAVARPLSAVVTVYWRNTDERSARP